MFNKKNVIKHSAATQVSSEGVSLLQRRAWNVLLANAYDDLLRKDVFEIPVRSLTDVLGFDSNNTEYLKAALRALNTIQVEWNILGKDNRQEWGVCTLLAEAEIKNGICYYSYASGLRRKLHHPSMYAKISLSLQNYFKSKHTLVLYELALDYYRARNGCGKLSSSALMI